jgi:hypothetical protein
MIAKITKKRLSKKNTSRKKQVARKKINWDKFFGKITFEIDGVAIQRQMRDEWGQ